MQPNRGRYSRALEALREDRSQSRGFRLVFSDRKPRNSVEARQEPLPGAPLGVDSDWLTHLAGLSLNKGGPDLKVDFKLAQLQLAHVCPTANQHPQQQLEEQQHQPFNISQTPGSNMDGMEETIQEREALMASLAHISDEAKSQCRINVLELFRDMDPDHLRLVCEQGRWNPGEVISQVVNDMEDGRPYPKMQKISLKRKRHDEEDADSPENAAKKWDNVGRRSQPRDAKSSYTRASHSILQQFFPQMYVENLKSFMALNGGILYPTYLLLSKAIAEGDEANPLFKKKKGRVPKSPPFLAGVLEERIQACRDEGEREALEEVRAARIAEQIKASEADETRRKEQQELENFEIARADGTIADCGCCFVEYAINRMVHCDGEEVHFFCRDCARTMAETQIGMAKYDLNCMSTDGCTGGFARSQREIFLDAKSRTVLEQIEMDASIRASGIDNIETCPFCPFAAEYPDLEVDREFRCLHNDCGIEHGCNKMTCTKCGNIQCYVCSKSCDYSHFNDTRRGGRAGNCDLFDKEGGVEARHQAEVKAAEEEARKKVQDEHKDVNPELLEFKESEKVKQDEARKKELIGRHRENRAGLLRMQADQFQGHLARRRDRLHALARGDPHAVAIGEAPPAPRYPFPAPGIQPPQPAHGLVAAVQDPVARLPGPAHVAHQEAAIDPALIWRRGAQAGQVQVPAQVPGLAPLPQPHVNYGMGHMMHFMPFGDGILDHAMDQTFGPAIRRGMPPQNYLDVQRPQDVADQNTHRPVRTAPKGRPKNLMNDLFLRGQNFGDFNFVFPLAPFQEQAPLAGPRRPHEAELAVADRLGARNSPDPPSPPPEQGRGYRDDPIILSSPVRPDLVDLTIDDGKGEAACKHSAVEDGHLWPNILDLERHWPIDREGLDPFCPNV
ncbi:hypothetical protein N0V93_007413 [Gnomoniopsis smithogilvyi]|uniref:RING-type domain-containing protein n=1 Tax=Gnomoniopsis smithogilvyi TaxID=1191159 RepID=A0A9W8YTR5_9PEZI|nr:hypothetical protein N0V93_007413 [Gnomoniopsis smithogilvyi]